MAYLVMYFLVNMGSIDSVTPLFSHARRPGGRNHGEGGCPASVPGRLVGTDYGGYLVPRELPEWLHARKDQLLLVYSFGLGLDVSFDLGIASQLNALGYTNVVVHQFDPTPRAIKFVRAVRTALREGVVGPAREKAISKAGAELTPDDAAKLTSTLAWAVGRRVTSPVMPRQLQHHNWGLGVAANETSARFYLPGDARCVSATSMAPSAARGCGGMHSSHYFTATLRSLQATVARLGHDASREAFHVMPGPHVLKIDVEGAEIEVLRALLASTLRPRLLCVDFDSLISAHTAHNRTGAHMIIRQLRAAGYVPVVDDPRAAALAKRHQSLPERTFVFCGGAQPRAVRARPGFARRLPVRP